MSEQQSGKLPEYLSPSSLGTFKQCPLKFKLSRIDKIAEPPTQETLMGNFVHEVLETLYKFDSSERTVGLAKSIATTVWAEGNWADTVKPYLKTFDMNQFRWNSWWCIENLFTIEDPKLLNPDGIEHELNGKIDNVQMRGFIDRWMLDGETLVISDYKTGKTPSPKYMSDKFFQLTIYTLLLNQDVDAKDAKLELLYLKDAVKRTHVPTTQELSEATETIVTIKKEIDTSYESGNWEAIPSRLCDWCSYKRTVCTYWNKKNE